MSGDHIAIRREQPRDDEPPGRAPPARPVRTRLFVGATDDASEREADRLAQRVMRQVGDRSSVGARPPVGRPPRSADHARIRPAAGTGFDGLPVHRAPVGRVGPGVVRRLALPANVIEQAGLHDFTEISVTGAETVTKGGITRSGILADIPPDTLLTYDSSRVTPDYVKVTWNGRTGYVKRRYLDLGQRLGTSDFYIVTDTGRASVRIWDATAGDYLPDVLPVAYRDQFAADLTTILDALARAEAAADLDVVKKRNVLINVMHQAALGAPVDVGLWPIAAGNITTVKQRVVADTPQLIRAGLITRHMELTGVEFTGADFHKGGQAPFFLHFTDPIGGATTKIVYKPSDLSVDRALFGADLPGGGSVATTMDPTGNYISQYKIVAAEDPAHHKYGYMEFVHSDTPTTADELRSVYESIAANMALSYLVGLEDVHHENVLLLRDRVQVIDMEATTGMFKMNPADLSSGGFAAMLWPKALSDGIKPKLEAARRAGTLAAIPATDEVTAAMRAAFTHALRRAARRKGTMEAHAADLAGQRSRVVPVATSEFYAMIHRVQQAGSLRAWRRLVDADADGAANPDRNLVTQARGATGHTREFVVRLLKSRGTYEALARGEVPYYSRDLSGSTIYDERGRAIDATGCSKVGLPIDEEMTGRLQQARDDRFSRRNADVSDSDVMKMFDTQILQGPITTMNDALLAI